MDLLEDLIWGIDAINGFTNCCIENKEAIDVLFTPEHKRDILKDFKIWELSGILTYKKIDKFSEGVKSHMNTHLSSTISQIAFMRTSMIQELFRAWIICDLCISEEKVFGTKEMLEHLVEWKERWEYKIKTNALFVSDTHFGVWKEKITYNKEDKSDIWGAVAILTLLKIIWVYGEDQLNTELNLDDSHKKMLFFNWEKEDIEDLRDTLIYWKGKKFLKSISFKNWETFINKQKWKYKKDDKADYALRLVALYFSEFPYEEQADISDLQNIHIHEKKKWVLTIPENFSFQDSFRTWYRKTLNDRFEKKFINGRIVEMNKSIVRINEMDNR